MLYWVGRKEKWWQGIDEVCGSLLIGEVDD